MWSLCWCMSNLAKPWNANEQIVQLSCLFLFNEFKFSLNTFGRLDTSLAKSVDSSGPSLRFLFLFVSVVNGVSSKSTLITCVLNGELNGCVFGFYMKKFHLNCQIENFIILCFCFILMFARNFMYLSWMVPNDSMIHQK